jgi:hypothetical protein
MDARSFGNRFGNETQSASMPFANCARAAHTIFLQRVREGNCHFSASLLSRAGEDTINHNSIIILHSVVFHFITSSLYFTHEEVATRELNIKRAANFILKRILSSEFYSTVRNFGSCEFLNNNPTLTIVSRAK